MSRKSSGFSVQSAASCVRAHTAMARSITRARGRRRARYKRAANAASSGPNAIARAEGLLGLEIVGVPRPAQPLVEDERAESERLALLHPASNPDGARPLAAECSATRGRGVQMDQGSATE